MVSAQENQCVLAGIFSRRLAVSCNRRVKIRKASVTTLKLDKNLFLITWLENNQVAQHCSAITSDRSILKAPGSVPPAGGSLLLPSVTSFRLPIYPAPLLLPVCFTNSPLRGPLMSYPLLAAVRHLSTRLQWLVKNTNGWRTREMPSGTPTRTEKTLRKHSKSSGEKPSGTQYPAEQSKGSCPTSRVFTSHCQA